MISLLLEKWAKKRFEKYIFIYIYIFNIIFTNKVLEYVCHLPETGPCNRAFKTHGEADACPRKIF